MTTGDTFLEPDGRLLITIVDAPGWSVEYRKTLLHAPVTTADQHDYNRQRSVYSAGLDRAILWVQKGFWKPENKE